MKSLSKQMLKKAKKQVLYRSLSCIIVRGIYLLVPLIFGNCINYIINGLYLKAIIMILIGLLVTIIAKICEIIMTYTWHKLHSKLYIEYTKLASTKIFFNTNKKTNSGEIMNILNSDINIMSTYFPDTIRKIIRAFEILVIFVYFFSIGFYFGFAGISATAFCLIIIERTNKNIVKVNDNMLKSYDKKINIINDILSHYSKTKKISEDTLINSTEEYVTEETKRRTAEDKVIYSILIIIEFFRWGILILGIYLVSKKKLEVGILLIIYNYYSQLIDSFNEFSSVIIKTKQFKLSENRFKKFVNN